MFRTVLAVWAVALALTQGVAWHTTHAFSFGSLFVFLLLGGCLWGILFCYFQRQSALLEQAVQQIQSCLDGNPDARLDCDREGELYRLFHSVNALAAVLSAHADNEQREKHFLKNTIADISHQLKTPLAALNIYNGLLQDEAVSPSEVKEFADLSEQELDRIETLVQNLLKITRLDAGSVVLEKKNENVAEMVQDIARQYNYRAEQEQKKLVLSGSAAVTLWCDRDWMQEAVDNLVKNALDHTQSGDTIWFAASSPARRAAKASPITAATGNAVENAAASPCHARLFGSRAELSLGVSHATSSKKNLLLMTGSFALSILLFLSFSVLLRWVGFALNPLQPYAPDLSVGETSGQNILDPVLVEQLEALPEVKHAFGRMYCPFPAEYQGKQGSIDLISYDTIQFGWAKKDLIGGTLPQEPEDGTYPVLTVFDKSNSLTVGDTIQLEDAKLTVVGVLNDSPFSSTDSPIVICTEETFHQLTGQNRYAVIDIQLKDTTADAAIAQIHTLLSDTLNKQVVFSNRIEGNRMIQSTYWAFHLVVYAFLIVIAGITILNIINSISMSVSARMKQYGILRAIGMDDAQLKRMISAEAGTYAVSGLVVGIALGLVLNRKLYILLITHYFGAAWQVPWGCLAVIVVVVLAAVVLAVYTPVRRILMQPITATISEL